MPSAIADSVRQAQAEALPASLARTGSCGVGLAVSYDIAEHDVAAVADRLALAALHGTFAAQCGGAKNRTDCDADAGQVCWWSGPRPINVTADGAQLTVHLEPCSAGL